MNKFRFVYIFTLLISFNSILFSQVKNYSVNKDFDRYEINVSINYSRPILETFGNDIDFDIVNEIITIDGKRLINSDNFATNFGYGIQVYGKMSLFHSNYIKAEGSIGFDQLASKYSLSNGTYYGVRMYVFSIGTGLQINPIGVHKFYPSLFGLFRFNEIGGETYHHAGLDFLIVSPRFGVSTGFNLNYKFNKKVGMSLGMTYNYDNMLNKQTQEGVFDDPHVINFRDAQSPTNGLVHDRRVAYVNITGGINIYFK